MGLWRWVIALFISSLVVTRWVVLPRLAGLAGLHSHALDPVTPLLLVIDGLPSITVGSFEWSETLDPRTRSGDFDPSAGVAQSVEQLPCKQQVTSSIPVASIAPRCTGQRIAWVPPPHAKPVSFLLAADVALTCASPFASRVSGIDAHSLARQANPPTEVEATQRSDGQLYFNSALVAKPANAEDLKSSVFRDVKVRALPRATPSPEPTPSFAAVAHSDRQVALKGSEPPAGGHESGASVGFWFWPELLGVIGLVFGGVYLAFYSYRVRKRLAQSEHIRRTLAAQMSADERELDTLTDAKRILQTWLDKQGHDRCWYYPDLFRELVKLFELESVKPAGLPSLAEFQEGCKRYQAEEYGLGGFTPPTAPAGPKAAKFDQAIGDSSVESVEHSLYGRTVTVLQRKWQPCVIADCVAPLGHAGDCDRREGLTPEQLESWRKRGPSDPC